MFKCDLVSWVDFLIEFRNRQTNSLVPLVFKLSLFGTFLPNAVPKLHHLMIFKLSSGFIGGQKLLSP